MNKTAVEVSEFYKFLDLFQVYRDLLAYYSFYLIRVYTEFIIKYYNIEKDDLLNVKLALLNIYL